MEEVTIQLENKGFCSKLIIIQVNSLNSDTENVHLKKSVLK